MIADGLRRLGSWLLYAAALLLLLCGFFFISSWPISHLLPEVSRLTPGLNISGARGRLADQIHIDSFEFENAQIALQLTDFNWQWQPRCIKAFKLCLDAITLDQLTIKLPPAAEAPASLDAQPLVLPDINLPFALRLDTLRVRHLRIEPHGAQAIDLDNIDLTADLDESGLQITRLNLDYQDLTLRAQGALQLNAGWQTDLALQLDGQIDAALPPISARLSLQGPVDNSLLSLQAQGVGTLNAGFHVDLTDPALPLRGALSLKQIQLPSQPAWSVPHLLVNIQGNLDLMQLAISGQVDGPDLPATQLKAEGSLQPTRALRLSSLTIETLGGRIDSSAAIAWANGLAGSADVRLSDLQPQRQWPELNGDLSGHLSTAFYQGRNGALVVDVPDLNLSGQWLGQPLSLTGHTRYADDGSLQIPELKLVNNNNLLTLSGRLLGDQIDVQLQPQLNALNTLYPELSGQLNGAISVTGSLTQPAIDANLQASNLAAFGVTLRAAQVQAQLTDLQQGAVQIQAQIQDLTQNDLHLDRATLDVQGTLAAHQLQLDIQGTPANAQLNLQGGWTQPSWQGQVTRLGLQGYAQKLALAEPVNVRLDTQNLHAALQPHCWRLNQGDICLRAPLQWEGAQLTGLDLDLSQIALKDAQPFLPPELVIDGALNARAQLQWQQDAPPRIQLRSQIDGLAVEHPAIPKDIDMQFSQFSLDLDGPVDGLNCDLNFSGRQFGQSRYQGRLERRPDGIWLDGRVRNSGIELAELRKLVPGLTKLNGSISLDSTIQGALPQPSIRGQLTLENLAATHQDAPVTLDAGGLKLDFDNNKATLNGELVTSAGTIDLSGDGTWQGALDAQLQVKSDRLQATIPPYGDAQVIPDVDIIYRDGNILVNGDIQIPQAKIVLPDFAEGGPVRSTDVVIIDDEQTNPIGSNLPYDVNLRVRLGEDVHLRGYGLATRLTGAVNARARAGYPLGLHGAIELKDGTYRSYGQNLQISNGEIILAGSPSNGRVDIEATRKNLPPWLVAGIRVTGPIARPSAEFFSDPVLTDEQILSYIVLGRAPDDNSGDQALLTQALLNSTFSQHAQTTREIGQQLGLQDLNLDTSGAGDSSALGVTGQINDRLSLRYDIGLFKPVRTLTLRYQLNKNVILQVIDGVSTAADVLYQFEFD